MLSLDTHRTILSVVTSVMNVGSQTSSASFTSSCPFCDCSRNLFTDQRMSGLPIRAKYKHFKTICEHTHVGQLSNRFQFLLLKIMVVETLYNYSVFLFANSQYCSTHFSHALSSHVTTRQLLRQVSPTQAFFCLFQQKIRDSNMLLCCSIIVSLSLRFHVECIPSTHGQDMVVVLQDLQVSSISSTWDSYSFHTFWCHPRTPIRIITVFDEQIDLPNLVLFPFKFH